MALVAGNTIRNEGGVVRARQRAHLQAKYEVFNVASAIVDAETTIVSAGKAIYNRDSEVLGSKMVYMAAEKGDIHNTRARIDGGSGRILLEAAGNIENDEWSSISALSGVNVRSFSNDIKNTSAEIFGGLGVSLDAKKDIFNQGSGAVIRAIDWVNLQAGRNLVVQNQAVVVAGNNLHLRAGNDLLLKNSELLAGKQIYASALKNLSNLDSKIISQRIRLAAIEGNVRNTGTIYAGRVDPLSLLRLDAKSRQYLPQSRAQLIALLAKAEDNAIESIEGIPYSKEELTALFESIEADELTLVGDDDVGMLSIVAGNDFENSAGGELLGNNFVSRY